MAVALLEEKLSGAPPCMRCSLINDLMKATTKVKRCGLGSIGRQAHQVKMRGGFVQQLLHEGFSCSAST